MVGPRRRFVRTTKVDGGVTWPRLPVVRAASWVLRCAYCRIEGRRVAVSGALSAPSAAAVPGAESVRDSSVFRNIFRGRPMGVARLMHLTDE
jgi:hypothetical protein